MVERVLSMHEVLGSMPGFSSSFLMFKIVLVESDGLSQVIITGWGISSHGRARA